MNKIIFEGIDVSKWPLSIETFERLASGNFNIEIVPCVLNVNNKNITHKKPINNFNRYLNETPWFVVNSKKFILGQATFANVSLDLTDYISEDQSIDNSLKVLPNEVSKLYINDQHGLKINMSFENISGKDAMQGDSVLKQFTVEYNPDNCKERAHFYNYVPFTFTEDRWRFYTNIKPISKIIARDIHSYKYIVNQISTEIWFDAKTNKLVAMIVNII